MTNTNIPLLKRYKYRIYPTKEQEESLTKLFGSCRFVYNKLLGETILAYELYKSKKDECLKPKLGKFDLTNKLTQLKRSGEYPWLYDVSSQALQQSVGNLADAFKNFFKYKRGYPKFKRRSNNQAATFTNQTAIVRDGKLLLGKIPGLIRVNWDKCGIPINYTGVTITKTPSGKYFASFIAESERVLTTGVGILGIDAGITDLYTFSDGTTVPNPRHFVNSQKRLARLQRSLSRKKKGSNNRNKLRIKVAKCHERIANLRNDYLHKLSTKLIRENQAIGIESLQVRNMVRNHRLAKHIADASWFKFREMLMYKAAFSTGCKIYLADPYFPSTQLCNSCGIKPTEKLTLGTRKWTCVHCGATHQRDHNAALNLKNLAERMHTSWRDRPESVIVSPAYA